MPRGKKQFRSTAPRAAKVGNDETLEATNLPPVETVVRLPENAAGSRKLDFDKHYGQGCDVVVYAAQRVLDRMAQASVESRGKTLSPSTIGGYFHHGLRYFLPFCATAAAGLGRDLRLDDIDRQLIDHFIAHLAQSGAIKQTQRERYTNTKSALVAMGQSGWIATDIFPRNPFPKTNRLQKGEKPLSEPEYKKVAQALNADLHAILKRSGPLNSRELVICLMAIVARTGINPTPAMELPVDCTRPHPLKSGRYVLISFKRRGNATHIQSLRRASEIESMASAMSSVSDIVDCVRDRNAAIREASRYPESLFVFETRGGTHTGELRRLSSKVLVREIGTFVERHRLQDADGNPLRLNVMRLRKTFVNILFDRSGGDPVLTAKLAGHAMKVSNDHYLEAPASAEKDWRLMGEVRTDELLSQAKVKPLPTENTPTAQCRDTLHGRFAPGDGEHCQQFLACFRCPSFVVTGDDLYRVFSLYWMLVRMRGKMRAKQWKRHYGHIIRIIDQDIAFQFDADLVDTQKRLAKVDPHPFWRDPAVLELESVA